MFSLPELPYGYDSLAPTLGETTLRTHHDKHHARYVTVANELLAKSGDKPESIEALVLQASASGDKKMFNNAGQAWNHGFFWESMTPTRGAPSAALAGAIEAAFGSLDKLKAAFVAAGVDQFGSGWVWLTADKAGALKIIATHDAEDTLTQKGLTPLLVCDLWEHAYYLDYQNERKGFLEAWFDALPHWAFAGYQLKASKGQGEPWRYPAPDAAKAQKTA